MIVNPRFITTVEAAGRFLLAEDCILMREVRLIRGELLGRQLTRLALVHVAPLLRSKHFTRTLATTIMKFAVFAKWL